MRRIEVTASTMGQANPSNVTLVRPYRWRGNADWEPGHPAYREDTPAPFTAGGAALTARRGQRVREFGRILTSLGAPDPASAPLELVIEAGKRLGVGEKTARSYRADLRKQGGAS